MPDGINYIDIIAIIALALGVFRGLRNGLVKEIAAIVALILGIWAGFRFAFVIAAWYRESTEIPENLVPFLAFLTTFILVLIAVIFAGKLLKNLLTKAKLSAMDKAGGAAFGAMKWGLVIGTLFVILGKAHILPEEHTKESLMYPMLSKYCHAVQEYSIGLIPDVKNVFTEMDQYFTDPETVRKIEEKTRPGP